MAMAVQIHQQRQAQLQLGPRRQGHQRSKIQLGADLGLGKVGDLEQLLAQSLIAQGNAGFHGFQLHLQAHLAVILDAAA